MRNRIGRLLVALACVQAPGVSGALAVDTIRTREIAAGASYGADAALHFDFAAEPAAGRIVVDASGRGRHGLAEGCAWRADGRFAGGALAFAGNASAVVAEAAPAFTAEEAYSASVWFRHDGGGDLGPQYGHKILDRTSPGHDWYLCLRPEGHADDAGSVLFVLGEGAHRVVLEDASQNWADGVWHHAVVLRDGGRGELWLDGTLRASTGAMASVLGTAPFCVGNSRSADRFQRTGWSGLLDEVRLFTRALAPEEIAGLCRNGTAAGGDGTVTFASDVRVEGALTVSGAATFEGGVRLARPSGDLSMGGYADGTVPDAR